jgi:chaperone required for assembly of F1-ATPase
MKRFYREVSLQPGAGGFELLLDGRPARTPAKRPLLLPTAALAEAVAAEWREQGEELRPDTMPLTQLACTTLDITERQELALQAELAAYGATDLLCYRAGQPVSLVARQAALWQPLLDWAAEALGAPLAVTEGVMAVAQPSASLEALAEAVRSHRSFALTALAQLVRTTGSLVLALAVALDRLDAAGAFATAELDESWQRELWGEDALAMSRRARLAADVEAAARLLALVRSH